MLHRRAPSEPARLPAPNCGDFRAVDQVRGSVRARLGGPTARTGCHRSVVGRRPPDPRARTRRAARARARPAGCAAPTCTSPRAICAPHAPAVVPGHEVVGAVDALGPGAARLRRRRTRVGIAWLRHTCGCAGSAAAATRTCASTPRFTGWDADGGYAEYAVVDERYAYAIPDAFADEHAAPLLCAGIIGYRSLRRAALPRGGRLGHLRLRRVGPPRRAGGDGRGRRGARDDPRRRRRGTLALELGAASAGDTADRPPVPLDAAILFAPAGELVPAALGALDRGGTLAIAGIHLTDVPSLDYQDHLFQERQLRSVTANTRADGEEFLAIAARHRHPRRDHAVPAGRRRHCARATSRTTASTAPRCSASLRRAGRSALVERQRHAHRGALRPGLDVE